jgi:hypothetical protein
MKNLLIILIALLSFTSCKKEMFKPEMPYICLVTSVDIESNVLVNGKKESLDSVVTRFVTDSSTMTKYPYKVYFYSFRLREGDRLEASVVNDVRVCVLGQSINVGMYFIDNIKSWKQLYFVGFFTQNMSLESGLVECYGDLNEILPISSISSIKYQHTFN